MCDVIDFGKERRARRGGTQNSPPRRARPNRREADGGFQSVGEISFELLRKLME